MTQCGHAAAFEASSWCADGHDDRPTQSGAEGEADRAGGESRGPWQGEAAAGLVLSTLYLAMEWILQAPPPNRSVWLVCLFLQPALLRWDKPHEDLCHSRAINRNWARRKIVIILTLHVVQSIGLRLSAWL